MKDVLTGWGVLERPREVAIGRRHVLVVDEDAEARVFVSRALMRAGYSVVTAPDEARAVRAIDKYQVPVVVRDLETWTASADVTSMVEAVDRAFERSMRG